MGIGNPMEAMRSRAQRQLVDNAHAANASSRSLEDRAKRWWDVPAKYDLAMRMAREEIDAFGPQANNNAGDALRHAVWSRRVAEATGPVFAEAAGLAHEADNLAYSLWAHSGGGPYDRDKVRHVATPGQTMDQIRMDLHNNAEGRRAAEEGRPIDPRRLQMAPRTPDGTAVYRAPQPGLEGLPPR